MALVTTNYASSASLTITLASLASSTTLTAGQESNVVDNSSNIYVDAIVEGKVTVGTTPTANTQIQIWVYGSFDVSPATTNIDVIDGVDSAEDFVTVGRRNSAVKLGAILDCSATTSDVSYFCAPFSVAQLFGGVMPKFWGLWITHNTGVALNATGSNHALKFTGVKYDVT